MENSITFNIFLLKPSLFIFFGAIIRYFIQTVKVAKLRVKLHKIFKTVLRVSGS